MSFGELYKKLCTNNYKLKWLLNSLYNLIIDFSRITKNVWRLLNLQIWSFPGDDLRSPDKSLKFVWVVPYAPQGTESEAVQKMAEQNVVGFARESRADTHLHLLSFCKGSNEMVLDDFLTKSEIF